MRKLVRAAAVALSFAFATPSIARAEEKLTGTVESVEVAKDKKSAVAILRDANTAQLVPITVVDDVTLQKFERSVIVVGDEIKCRYEKKGEKKVATYFKKAGGC